jgi:RNA polymerase sigma factor (sigma-70 family)
MQSTSFVGDDYLKTMVNSTEAQDFGRFAYLLQEGNDDAAQLLLRKYAVRMREIAARHIGAALRPKVDPEDVVQSVLGSFFANLRAGKYDIDSSRNLRGLLSVMVARKCARYANRYSVVNRDWRRERSASQNHGDGETEELLMDRESLPDESVMMTELLDRWIATFDATDRRIIELLLLGHSTNEITLQVHCSQRTVQRTVQRLVQRLAIDT